MKSKRMAIIATMVITILAVTSVTLPALANISSPIAQQQIVRQQKTLLLAVGNENNRNGGHTTNIRPSTLEKHQNAEAQRQAQQVNKEFKNYKSNGGKLAKDSWINAGKPKKDK